MTKEELERIKQAYYSGLKVQIWFNGHWENFDARDYSMYSDPFSENRLYRIVGSAYADIAENRISELEKENAELKEKLNFSTQYYQGEKAKEQLTEAKEIIKMLHSDCYSIAECEDTNLGLWEDDLAKAEQFLNNEVEK